MDSPHRQARTIARTSARQERSSPYTRPRTQSLALQSTQSRQPSSSFLTLLGRAVSWWVGTGPTNGASRDAEGRLSDEDMEERPEEEEEERDGTMTPLGPPGGFSRSIAPPEKTQDEDDDVQIISPPPPKEPPPEPAAAAPQTPAPAPRVSSFNSFARSFQPVTPQQSVSSSQVPPYGEDKSPERINAAISEFFAKKGSEPLSPIEWAGVQKMLEDLRQATADGSGESFKLSAPAYSTPTFRVGTPDRSTQLRASRSVAASPRRSTPVRGTPPLYIGPGFGGNSRMRSSTKRDPPPVPKPETPTPAEKNTSLTRSTLSASMLAAPSSNTPATPAKAAEPVNPSISRLTRQPSAPSPLRNAISQTSPSGDRVSPPKRGPTIAASLLKDLLDAGKKDSSPLQNPYLNRPGAIKGKIRPKSKPATPTRASDEPAKPAVNGTKVPESPAPEPQTGAKRDAKAASLDEPAAPTASSSLFASKEQRAAAPSPPAAKRARTSFADAQEVFDLLEADQDSQPAPQTHKTAAASQETGEPNPTSSTSLFGTNGGFTFPKSSTNVPSFDFLSSSSSTSKPSFTAPSFDFSSTSSTKADAAPPSFGLTFPTPKPDNPTPSFGLSFPTSKSDASNSSFGLSFPSSKPDAAPLSFGIPSTSSSKSDSAPGLFGSSATGTDSQAAKKADDTAKAAPFGGSGLFTSSAQPPLFPSTASSFSGLDKPSEPSTTPTKPPPSNLFGQPSAPSFSADSFGATKPTPAPPFGASNVFGMGSSAATSSSADKPITFGGPGGSKSLFGVAMKTSTAPAPPSATSLFGGFGSTSTSTSDTFGLPATKPTTSEAPATKDVEMEAAPAPASSASGWDKIMAHASFHKSAKPEEPKVDAATTKSDAALPMFYFKVATTPSADAAAAVPKDQLPIFSFDKKLTPSGPSATIGSASSASASSGAGTAAAPAKPPAPVVAFDFAAAGLSKPTSSGSTWECPVCMISNKADAAKCAACESDRPGGAPAPAKPAAAPAMPTPPPVVNNWAGVWAPPAPPSGKVTCKHCGLMTDKGLEKCQVCDLKDYE